MKVYELFESGDSEDLKNKLQEHTKNVVNLVNKFSKTPKIGVSFIKKNNRTISVVEEEVSVVDMEFYSDYHCFKKDKGTKEFLDIDIVDSNRFVEGYLIKKFGLLFKLSNGDELRAGGRTCLRNDSIFESEIFYISVLGQDGTKMSPLSVVMNKACKKFKKDFTDISISALQAYDAVMGAAIKKARL